MARCRRRFGGCRRCARFAGAPRIDGRRHSGARLEWPRHPRRTRIDREPSACGFGAASGPRHLGTRGAAARRRGLAALTRSSTWKRGDAERKRRRPDRPGRPTGVNVERPRRASRCEPNEALRQAQASGIDMDADLLSRLRAVVSANAVLAGTIGSPTATGVLAATNLHYGETGPGNASASFAATKAVSASIRYRSQLERTRSPAVR